MIDAWIYENRNILTVNVSSAVFISIMMSSPPKKLRVMVAKKAT
ncbi:hypothetical protein JM83_0954 [Gillisia sp. Hel_I_86]|nr:hypothetical protein JM83_0954 [Gillisia sp. Hel_I_86]